ncbi:MAG TPA: ATP-binding protein, partial [Candidatus Obscuribacterales bacterium]
GRVLLEELLKDKSCPPRTHQLMARLLVAEGRLAEARGHYKQALEQNVTLQDPELDRQLFMQVSSQLDRQATVSGQEEPHPLRESMREPEPIREPIREAVGESHLLPAAGIEAEKPHLSFADVGGMEGVKEAIELKIIQPLKHPDLYRAYGKPIGGGLLMYGPPGCGKTHLARATAGEVKAGFISVGINEILEMWLGQSERNLHAVFEQARADRPCVLFFDEVDALGASRSDMRHSAGRQLINQFLLELDGVRYSNEGVLILAATNAPWHLDTAFRRPGRFDRMLFVPPPDLPSRCAIFEILLTGRPIEQLDYEALAKKSEGFSGADLAAVVDSAVEDKLKDALKTGQPAPIRQKDLLKALKRVRPSTREWFTTARNYALYANQSGFYDEILSYLNLK